jgi:hypothetical protein
VDQAKNDRVKMFHCDHFPVILSYWCQAASPQAGTTTVAGEIHLCAQSG